ncbi:MAG: nitroreductase family protein [Treponema sp.]|nr:nitroreductase family protein [Treponema sp.]
MNSYEALLSLCQKRHSTRAFSAQPVSEEQIEKIRTIALTSPYASGRKNWELIVITEKETIARMADAVRDQTAIIASQIRAGFAGDFLAYAGNFTVFTQAPAVFIPAFKNTLSLSLMFDRNKDIGNKEEIAKWEHDNYIKSISCVSMLVLLAAESLGLAGCYMTGPLIAEKTLGDIINVKPNRSIGALIPVGFKAGE